MEYTKKHKNLIAKLFKKAGMFEEANFPTLTLELRVSDEET